MSNWYRFEVEGVIENGHRKNWYELFFEMIGENDPGEQFYRPALRTDRINNNPSNISKLATGKKSILICNKATAMMRTCKASDIINSLSAEVKEEFSIFVYESNLEKNENITGATIIGKSSFDTFLLDLYDADLVISVDTGAIHFREGIQKMAIGLYNSFTVDSRTKYYQFTSSFDIKSNCELQPCFKHERPFDTFCQKGNETMFAAPCFDSKYNKTLIKQLSEIFKII